MSDSQKRPRENDGLLLERDTKRTKVNNKPRYNGMDLDVIEDAGQLYWNLVHGIDPPENYLSIEDDDALPLPKTKIKRFKKIAQAYKETDEELNGMGGIVAEDATASKQWLLERGLPENKTWKRFYSVPLRRYHYDLFMAAYPEKRCFYEVIRKGWPCHLYADVEVYPGTNDRLQTLEQFNEYMKVVLNEFEEWVCEFLNIDRSVDMVRHTLESSGFDPDTGAATKFSRHYKWDITAMFTDNTHVRSVFMRFECYIGSKYGPSTRDANIFYTWKENIKHNPPDGFRDKAFIFDMGVYTSDRMFRTLGCTKLGRKRYLQMYDDDIGIVPSCLGEENLIDGTPTDDQSAEYSLEDTIRYSVLCPRRELWGTSISLLTITQPDGSASKSSSDLYSHRTDQHPHHVSVKSNGTIVNDSHIPVMENFMTYKDGEDEGDDDTTTGGQKPLCRGHEWNGHNGRSKKPTFCTAMGSMFCASFSAKLAEWGRKKGRTVPVIKMDHADFNRDKMMLFVTYKNYCHVQHADRNSTSVSHRSNRGAFKLYLTTMTYTCYCYKQEHRNFHTAAQSIMPEVVKKFGNRVEKFIKTFNERYGLDPARELFKMFNQLQMGVYATSEDEEEEGSDDEGGDIATQGIVSVG